MAVNHPTILLAPVLRAEKWTSIDLHRANTLEQYARSAPDWRVVDIAPEEGLARLPFGKRIIRDFLYPWRARRMGAQYNQSGTRPILHVIDHSYGHLCAAWQPSVVTCHDLNHFTAPTLTGLALHAWRLRVSMMKRAERIFTVSETLAREVRHHLDLPDEKVVVAYNGIDTEMFRPLPREQAAARFPELAVLAEKHLLVLNIGNNIERKNLPTLLRAVAHLRKERSLPVQLVKVGPHLREDGFGPMIDELGIAEAIIDLGVIPPADVALVCQLCHALSFPSTYEGFGRPTLEAQACRLPAVLADASCMREVGGAGALYHEPKNFVQLSQFLEKVMTDAPVRERLCDEGEKNIQGFTWEAHVKKLVYVYEEIAAKA